MKFKYLLFSLLIYIYLIINVSAVEVSLSTSTKKIKKDPVLVSLKFKLDEGEEVDSISFDLDYDTSVIKVEGVKDHCSDLGYNFQKNGSSYVVSPIEGKFENSGEDKMQPTVFIHLNVSNIASESTKTYLNIKNIKINNTTKLDSVNIDDFEVSYTTTTTAKPGNAKISNMVVTGDVKPAFSKDIFEYKIKVKDTIQSIIFKPQFIDPDGVQVSAECEEGCEVDNSNVNKIHLEKEVKNIVTFTYTSGEDKQVYKYTIYRGATTDGSSKLINLGIIDFEIENLNEDHEGFNKDDLDYYVSVPYDIETVDLDITPEDVNADVKTKTIESLEVGENVFSVTITSADDPDDKTIYNITVNRLEEDEEPTTQTVEEKIVSDISIKKDSGSNKLWLIIIIIIISLLIIGFSYYFIFIFNKKKNKNKKTKTNTEVSIKENELKEDFNKIDEEFEPTSVDDALADLMQTKKLNIKK